LSQSPVLFKSVLSAGAMVAWLLLLNLFGTWAAGTTDCPAEMGDEEALLAHSTGLVPKWCLDLKVEVEKAKWEEKKAEWHYDKFGIPPPPSCPSTSCFHRPASEIQGRWSYPHLNVSDLPPTCNQNSTSGIITVTKFLITYLGNAQDQISEAAIKTWLDKFAALNAASKVTETEVVAYFRQFDANGNGQLTETELVNGLCALSDAELLIVLRFVERRIHPQCQSTGNAALLETEDEGNMTTLDSSLVRKGCTPDVMCPILKTACAIAIPIGLATVAGCIAGDSALTLACAGAAGGPEDPLSFGCLTVGLLITGPCTAAVGAGIVFDAALCFKAVQSKFNCCTR